jgi:hypothetical protein
LEDVKSSMGAKPEEELGVWLYKYAACDSAMGQSSFSEYPGQWRAAWIIIVLAL